MILVTGATGLVGSHLVFQLLKKGLEVRVVKRPTSSTLNTLKVFSYYDKNAQVLFDKIEWVDADLMDVEEVDTIFNNISEVFHCAAMVSFAPRDKKTLLKYNAEITANLVNASLRKDVKKFGMISSVAVLDKSQDKETTETDYWKNDPDISVYGISKYMSEMEVWRGVEEGLNAVIVNPSLILGPGNWSNSSSVLFKTAHKGMPFYTNGTNGFVDVRDVAGAIIELMEKNIFGERFILNSDNWPLRNSFTEMAKSLGSKPPHIEMSKKVAGFYWRFQWLKSLIFGTQPTVTKETVHTAYSNTRFNSQKIRDAIGMEFIPIQKSIEEFSQFYLSDLEKS
jgi:dihydroflavonol-4-reductase